MLCSQDGGVVFRTKVIALVDFHTVCSRVHLLTYYSA